MLAQFKPYLTSLIMPPTSLMVLILLGLVLLYSKKHASKGRKLIAGSTLLLALLSTNHVAVWLNDHLLPSTPALQMSALQQMKPGAIVILGGGVDAASLYGPSQLQTTTLDRLRYGVLLHKKTSIPMLFTGGQGWGVDERLESEASVCQRVAEEVFGVHMRWLESQSRDTQENALNTFQILRAEGISKIVLVTNAWHMPRSLLQFKAAGFEVLPAPMGPIINSSDTNLSWIPSADGLKKSSTVLREALALVILRLKP
jgi:uncharacterized SAM-binding protein YcdF (DUF218 family)